MYICSIPFTLVSMPRATGKNGKKLAKASNKPGEAQGEKSDIFKITKMIMERNYEPVGVRPLYNCMYIYNVYMTQY